MSIPDWGTVRDCMGPKVTEIDGRLDVLSAMKVMKKVGSTSLIVKRRDEDDEYGMLLFADIAKQVIAKNRAPERVSVYEIMVKPVLMVRPDMKVRYCARFFEKFRVSHAPVLEDGNIIGMVSYYRLMLHGLPDLD
jgi:predicted transcriptional regulator